ncbi:hypothetical protein AB4Z29_24910 [Paenibacillus sp. 2TAB23]|uniref:hypothetical protein n=1 Tax=Paenibacillus sp. 2TAB23 TaxID=3233004 RepID=UPI003F9A7970
MVHSYKIPPLLDEIMTWEKEIKQQVPYLETPTGYFLKFDPNENGGYQSSPADAIMFAGTGMGGIHFSFLTDFGLVTDLNVAPIICVDPMDFGNCARVVANNIKDFFALHFSNHEGLLLNRFESEEDYLEYLKPKEEDAESYEYFDKKMWDLQKNEVRELAIKRFGFQHILDGYSYLQEVRQARLKELFVTTFDGLGIASHGTAVDSLKKQAPHPWHMKEIPYREVEKMNAYIESAEQAGLFGFIRDCQVQGMDDYEVIRVIYDRLVSFGFPLEAERLVNCMDI